MPTFKNHPCPTCGTIKYKRTSDAGLVCKYGHQMVGYVEEAGDADALIGVRSTKRKKAATTAEVTKRLYGAELEDALKRIFQYSLQIMARSFVQDLGFPVEFEYVVRELWILYLNDSKLTLINAHMVNNYVSGTGSSYGGANDMFMAFDEEPEDLLMERNSDSEDNNDNDKKVDHILPNNDATNGSKSTTRKTKKKTTAQWPRLRFRHILIFCYLGCMYLGWPVTLEDIRRWCASLRLPYLHILKDLPSDTLDLVDLRHMMHALQLPPTYRMRSDTSLFTTAFTTRTSVLLPKPNAPLLIYRYCTQLFLPVEMYFCARLIYEEHPYSSWGSRETTNNNYHNFDSNVMVIVLVLAKLCYGLDDTKDMDPAYHDDSLARPLPKQVWLEHIRANAARWDHIYQSKMIDSPDIELDLIIDYLKHLPDDRHRRKEKKSLVRRYIMKMQNGLDNITTRQSNWSYGLLVDTPKLASTIDEKDGNDGGDKAKTRVIGDVYMVLKKQAIVRGKVMFPEEDELVLHLASRILGCNAQTLQNRLVTYENYLKKLK